MNEAKIGFTPPGSDRTFSGDVEQDSEPKVQLTVILPRAQYEALAKLAHERSLQRGEQPARTNAIAGEANPLHNTGRGLFNS